MWNPDPHDNVRTALELWVEKGTAPGAIIASKMSAGPSEAGDAQSKPLMTRPLCPFPQVAQYKGSGDSNSAESFVCAAEKNSQELETGSSMRNISLLVLNPRGS